MPDQCEVHLTLKRNMRGMWCAKWMSRRVHTHKSCWGCDSAKSIHSSPNHAILLWRKVQYNMVTNTNSHTHTKVLFFQIKWCITKLNPLNLTLLEIPFWILGRWETFWVLLSGLPHFTKLWYVSDPPHENFFLSNTRINNTPLWSCKPQGWREWYK